jgi:hypothetical protein
VLIQEFHALAFCSENLQQIDFTNSSRSLPPRLVAGLNAMPGVQFLSPILPLLRFDLTRCNHLILARNKLGRYDIGEIGK